LSAFGAAVHFIDSFGIKVGIKVKVLLTIDKETKQQFNKVNKILDTLVKFLI